MSKSVLIFPAGMPRSLAYLDHALSEGQRVVGSSSLRYDPARERYPFWVYLPYVTAADFETSLRIAITEFDIGGIYTPNPVVWNHLRRIMGESFPGVSLVNSSPVHREVEPYLKALQFARSVLDEPLNLGANGPTKPPLSTTAIAALFRHADVIPGMCDHDKIHAFCELFRFAPLGDVVEIGSWWGKSAFALIWLACSYNVGKLLCVDPWANEHLVQNDDKGLVDQVPVNADEALIVFQINLLPYSHGSVNYLRMPSVQAARAYRSSQVVVTPLFGETHYSGHISILHIDGNHSPQNVSADIAEWTSFVLPGGWIIIDDYTWPYGKGPQTVGDEFLSSNSDRIEISFVMGGALFIRLKARISRR
jgi:hypothetical protein